MTTTPDRSSPHINLYCLREVLDHNDGQFCGCPVCCAESGVTALYTLLDFKPGVRPLGYWEKCLCEEKLALMCQERIVPGWPGSEERKDVR